MALSNFVSVQVALLASLMTPVKVIGQAALTGYKEEFTPNMDVVYMLSQASWPTSATNLQNCALLCSGLQNCELFSINNLANGSTVCKASTYRNSVVSSGSQLYYKMIVDQDGFSTYLDPFRYKLVTTPVTSSVDAAEVCESMGALLPVAFPSQKAFDTLRTFMPPTGAIFIGITLTGVDNATGNQSFVTDRGWNFKANPTNLDPNQHWLPGEPKLQHDDHDLSDIGVMMTPEGWYTVNTASGDVLTSTVICLRHTIYEIVDVSKKFYRFQALPTVDQATAAMTCKSEEAYLATLLGDQGRRVMEYFQTRGDLFWIGGYRPTPSENIFVFEDGTTVDARTVAMRWADPRQLWAILDTPYSTLSHNCLREYANLWTNCCDCLALEEFLCEGGF